ncbi:ABC-2 type transport system permease protein [Dyella jiangningensis]|uniref:ABC transporter permease n=1 Tax=Dyella sp. AtDHG13 TaxID=1938897 RepID=UPI000882D428|nr:ABC transporter permease [Dyella sp. AtDHG13]PXV61755.1 ABC-2 type transport system permease protein [Dyella sp. AtDHG13]SDJ64967.1 ABC-2 type transport system permease protein [Dyella jiangningensis]
MSRSGFMQRMVALTRKEVRQMLRDRSNLAVGLLLPIALILLFGYGLSLDVEHSPVAVVMDDTSPAAREVFAAFQGTPYIDPTWAPDMQQAQRRMLAGELDAIVRIPSDFSQHVANGDAKVQLLLNGVDSTTATSVEGYVGGALATQALKMADRAGGKAGGGGVVVQQRMWFNEAGISTWYLVPGLLVLIMTLTGAFLTSLLIAREWERGTLESLFVTPVRPLELVLSKLIPYVVIGLIDMTLCLIAARWLFEVPIRGSLTVIVLASFLYLVVSLSMGLFISGVTRNQFQASQMALLTSFMPAMMLSGFVFDLRNVPAVIRGIGEVLPATHFMNLIKTLFLAGDNAAIVLRECGILALYATVLIVAARRTLRKTLDR